jgi:hypothetical protein
VQCVSSSGFGLATSPGPPEVWLPTRIKTLEAHVIFYVIFVVPPSLVGVAVVLAVIRAKKEDLPAIVRALMRTGPRDDDKRDDPPSLPKP